MERESFMSSEIAQLLNASFVPIKVDREERPDIDDIYMNYVQATTGSGGWPLNVFLTPDLEPVFGGTYWPGPNSSTAAMAIGDTVSFVDILQKMRDVWQSQEDKCRSSAKEITRQLKEFAEEGVHSHRTQLGEANEGNGLDIELLEEAYQHFEKRYDKLNGGFTTAPKFPTPVNLGFLLRLGQWPDTVKDIVGEYECINAAAMAVNTLRKMARGGIRDQIGYGFARYSVTADWSLPHFEKMLYDQAQLLDLYLDAFIVTHDPELLGAVFDIATYLTSPPIAAPTGGFYSAEDADSYPTHMDTEKREGAYYVWTLKEFKSVLGDGDADICARFYGVTANGNVAKDNDPHDEFINQNVLAVNSTPGALAKEFGMTEEAIVARLKSSRTKLRKYRDRGRPRPALDDKIVVAWNGLAIGALARTSNVLAEIDRERANEFRNASQKAADFIKTELYDDVTGSLWRLYREGRGDVPGFADDYAFLIKGLIDLYEATFDDGYLQWADKLMSKLLLSVQFSISSNACPSIKQRQLSAILTATQISAFLSPTGAFFTTPSPASSPAIKAPSDLLLRLKSGMDSAEPSSNSISASNLFRLSSLFNDSSYDRLGRETVAAFEAEIEQWPHCFGGMLAGVVMARLGVKGVVLSYGAGFLGGLWRDTKAEEQVDEAATMMTRGTGVGRTVCKIGGGTGAWLSGRNGLLAGVKGSRVLVCQAGACSEGLEHI